MRRLCSLEQLAGCQAVTIDSPDDGPDWILVQTQEGPRAFLNACPHQGRTLDFAPGEFLFTRDGRLVCPHHGAAFEMPSGTCVDGPCRGEALRSIAVAVRDGAAWSTED